MTLEHAIVAFFQLYASAFGECDVDKITSLWSFPAYISAEERGAQRAFRSEPISGVRYGTKWSSLRYATVDVMQKICASRLWGKHGAWLFM